MTPAEVLARALEYRDYVFTLVEAGEADDDDLREAERGVRAAQDRLAGVPA